MEVFVQKIYNMKSYEIELVNDALDYIYSYFDKKGKSIVFETPTIEAYNLYYKALNDVLNNTFGKSIIQNGQFFIGDSPLSVLVLTLEGVYSEVPQINTDSISAKQLLTELDTMLTEERNNIYIRRNVRIYGKDMIYIIKPMQKKYLNFSSACRDADEIFADIMKTWRANNE